MTAQDGGSPPRHGSCNISVSVEDLNDNAPRFDKEAYAASVPEDAPTDTSVLRVRASDPDIGLNARILYSLANESQWLFRIDNRTGVITTAGLVEFSLNSIKRGSRWRSLRMQFSAQNVYSPCISEDVDSARARSQPSWPPVQIRQSVPPMQAECAICKVCVCRRLRLCSCCRVTQNSEQCRRVLSTWPISARDRLLGGKPLRAAF